MQRCLLPSLACILVLLAASAAQEEKNDRKVLKNADIITMVQSHFDDDTLVKVIEVSKKDFDVSEDALVELMRRGVSSPVLRVMLASAHHKELAANKPVVPAESAKVPEDPDSSPAAPPSESSSAQTIDPNFATRSPEATPPAPSATPISKPPAASNPAQRISMPNAAMMRMNPQQLGMMRSQLASMGMGGMLGDMGGMGEPYAMNYPPEQMPHVFLKVGHNEGKQEISASTAQIGQTNYKGGTGAGGMALRSLATEGLSFAAMGAGPAGMMAMSAFSMASGFMPGMRPGVPKTTYVWGLPGRKSARELTDLNPMFELSYGDIPGVDPDAYEPTLLKLVQSKDNYRLVGATQIKMTAKNMRKGGGPENGKWISEQRWPCHSNKEERGFYILHADSPLEPGEYAVVLRPVKGYKAVSSGLGGHAQVFYSVWDFSVPGMTPEDNGKKKTKK